MRAAEKTGRHPSLNTVQGNLSFSIHRDDSKSTNSMLQIRKEWWMLKRVSGDATLAVRDRSLCQTLLAPQDIPTIRRRRFGRGNCARLASTAAARLYNLHACVCWMGRQTRVSVSWFYSQAWHTRLVTAKSLRQRNAETRLAHFLIKHALADFVSCRRPSDVCLHLLRAVLEVFFNFFNNKKTMFCIFYQVNLTGSGLFK